MFAELGDSVGAPQMSENLGALLPTEPPCHILNIVTFSFFLSYLKIEFWDCLNKEFIVLHPPAAGLLPVQWEWSLFCHGYRSFIHPQKS